MKRRKRSKGPDADPPEPAPSLAERVHAERGTLFKAGSIIGCCRLACASKLVNHNPELMADALQASYDLISDACEGLEFVIDGFGDARTSATDGPAKVELN